MNTEKYPVYEYLTSWKEFKHLTDKRFRQCGMWKKNHPWTIYNNIAHGHHFKLRTHTHLHASMDYFVCKQNTNISNREINH